MAQAELDGQDRKVYLDTTSLPGTRQELENIATAAGLNILNKASSNLVCGGNKLP